MDRMTTYIQQGARVTITAAANVAAGDAVKIGDNFYGIAEKPISSGGEGTVSLEGVYAIAAAESISAGVQVHINGSGLAYVTSGGSDDKIGRALNTVTSGGLCKVLLNA